MRERMILALGGDARENLCVKKRRPIAEARERVPPLASRSRTFSEAWADFTRDADLDELDIDPDEVFRGVRDQSAGCDRRLRR